MMTREEYVKKRNEIVLKFHNELDAIDKEYNRQLYDGMSTARMQDSYNKGLNEKSIYKNSIIKIVKKFLDSNTKEVFTIHDVYEFAAKNDYERFKTMGKITLSNNLRKLREKGYLVVVKKENRNCYYKKGKKELSVIG